MTSSAEEVYRQCFRPNHSIVDGSGLVLQSTKVNGKLYPGFKAENIESIPDTEIRDDDVMLCGYSKSGCHWLMEIINMLLNGKIEYTEDSKRTSMLGFSSKEQLASLPSPRVLNTHIHYSDLPKAVFNKRTKIVLTVRNPKDTLVSYYHHAITLGRGYKEGKFDDFFKLFMEGNIWNGSYFDHLLNWDIALRSNGEPNPILIVPFEKMKADPMKMVGQIATFLSLSFSEEFLEEVVEACSFKKVKQTRVEQNWISKDLYRKGQVGDWKNVLSKEQSDAIDQVWKDRMMGCLYQPDLN